MPSDKVCTRDCGLGQVAVNDEVPQNTKRLRNCFTERIRCLLCEHASAEHDHTSSTNAQKWIQGGVSQCHALRVGKMYQARLVVWASRVHTFVPEVDVASAIP